MNTWETSSKYNHSLLAWEFLNYPLVQAVDVQVSWHSDSRLAMTVVATINYIFYVLFLVSPLRPFLLEGVLESKNLFSKIEGSAQNPRGSHQILNIPSPSPPWIAK